MSNHDMTRTDDHLVGLSIVALAIVIFFVLSAE
jgi:hypothetical protein